MVAALMLETNRRSSLLVLCTSHTCFGINLVHFSDVKFALLLIIPPLKHLKVTQLHMYILYACICQACVIQYPSCQVVFILYTNYFLRHVMHFILEFYFVVSLDLTGFDLAVGPRSPLSVHPSPCQTAM